jgi:hypothetical protein
MDKDEAQRNLTKAIYDHAEAFDMLPEDTIINDYAVIVNWSPIEENQMSSYTVGYSTETLPSHVAQGLFAIGTDISKGLLEQYRDD